LRSFLRNDFAAVFVEDEESLNRTDFARVNDLVGRRALGRGRECADDFFVELEEVGSNLYAVAAADAELAINSYGQLADLLFNDLAHDEKLMDLSGVGQTR